MNQSQSPVIACEPLDDVIDRLRAADKIREQLERDARRAKALGIPLNPKQEAVILARLVQAAGRAAAFLRALDLGRSISAELDAAVAAATAEPRPGRPARNGDETRFHAKAQRREEETLRCPR
jgi:hypothetical protein